MLRPPHRAIDDDVVVLFYERNFDEAGWSVYHGQSPAGAVVTFELDEALVTVSTEGLAGEGEYTLLVTHPF